MLCSRFLKNPEQQRHGRLYNASEKVFASWLRGYDWSLRAVLRHRFATLLVSFVVIALTGVLFVFSKTGFLPNEDQGLVFAFTEAQQGIAFDDMVRLQQSVASVIRQDPNVQSSMSSLGNPLNQGGSFSD